MTSRSQVKNPEHRVLRTYANRIRNSSARPCEEVRRRLLPDGARRSGNGRTGNKQLLNGFNFVMGDVFAVAVA
jgi:hypothetical protein